MSEKHLARYVNEFAGRHNIRSKDTIAQMNLIAQGMVGKRLRYKDLTAQRIANRLMIYAFFGILLWFGALVSDFDHWFSRLVVVGVPLWFVYLWWSTK